MRIRHIYPSATCRGEVTGPVGFTIGSAVNWFSLSTERQSRYEGWYIEDARTVPHSFTKILERITYLKGEGLDVPVEPIGVTLNGEHAFWEYGDGARLGFATANRAPGLRIEAARRIGIGLTFDIKGIYQQPETGRNYQVRQMPGGDIFIQYDDPLLGATIYVALKTDGEIRLDQKWQDVSYPWDTARNSGTGIGHVYDLGVYQATWIALGASTTAEAAQQACYEAAHTSLPVVGIGVAHTHDSLAEQVKAARVAAAHTLRMVRHHTGTYAGLPWFHQVWTRDELIAALGTSKNEQLELIRKYTQTQLGSGELPTYIGSGTTCADGVGWLAFLIKEYGIKELGEDEKAKVIHFLEEARSSLLTHRLSPEQLISSGHNATWMDTIGRAGCRIEIQAMFALVLELLAELTDKDTYRDERAQWHERIRTFFFKQKVLWDGHDDETIRPNCFLAYLLQPDLLKPAEWERVFGTALAVLRTSWGGLSSLDKTNPAFQAHSTGEDNRSYHLGDSWFFINNLSGVALARFGMKQFKPVVHELLKSSTEEILWKHSVGDAGEIASASDGASWGCGAQAFAAGTYLFFSEEAA